MDETGSAVDETGVEDEIGIEHLIDIVDETGTEDGSGG